MIPKHISANESQTNPVVEIIFDPSIKKDRRKPKFYIFCSPGSIQVSFKSVLNHKYKQLADNPIVRALLVEDLVKKRAPYSPLRIDTGTVKFVGECFCLFCTTQLTLVVSKSKSPAKLDI